VLVRDDAWFSAAWPLNAATVMPSRSMRIRCECPGASADVLRPSGRRGRVAAAVATAPEASARKRDARLAVAAADDRIGRPMASRLPAHSMPGSTRRKPLAAEIRCCRCVPRKGAHRPGDVKTRARAVTPRLLFELRLRRASSWLGLRPLRTSKRPGCGRRPASDPTGAVWRRPAGLSRLHWARCWRPPP